MYTEELKYGFYNSKADSKREYSAKEFGEMFMGVITEGIFPTVGDKFNVRKLNDGMKIEVGTGRAWLKNTYSYLPVPINFELEVGDSQYDRIDTVVLRIGCSELIRENAIYVKTGTPSANPIPPELEGDPTIEGLNVYEYPLACITVPINSESLDNSEITNLSGAEESQYYDSKYLAKTNSVLSTTDVGKTTIFVDTSGWEQLDDGTGTKYYRKKVYAAPKITNDAIINVDLFVNNPSETNTIDMIQKQEDAFGQVFKYYMESGYLNIMSYSIPEVNYTLRITGKGVVDV